MFGYKNFLRLNKGVQLLLPVLEAYSEICRSFGAPKEIEIVTKTLMLIESSHRAEEAILSFKRNRGILIHNPSLLRRARQRSGEDCSISSTPFWRLFAEQIKFVFRNSKSLLMRPAAALLLRATSAPRRRLLEHLGKD